MNVVSSTIISAMPSTPSVKRTPHDGIHGRSNALLPAVEARVERPPEPEREHELEREDGSVASAARTARRAGRDLVARLPRRDAAVHADEQRAEQRNEPAVPGGSSCCSRWTAGSRASR